MNPAYLCIVEESAHGEGSKRIVSPSPEPEAASGIHIPEKTLVFAVRVPEPWEIEDLDIRHERLLVPFPILGGVLNNGRYRKDRRIEDQRSRARGRKTESGTQYTAAALAADVYRVPDSPRGKDLRHERGLLIPS